VTIGASRCGSKALRLPPLAERPTGPLQFVGERVALPMPQPWLGVLTTPEAAEIFGVTAATVRILADSGELPHWKTAGGHRRFLEEEVRALRLDRDTKNRSGSAGTRYVPVKA
jgi:excisionase family DNA binding protein